MQEFTPIFDEVCQHTGLVPAAVYGVVWRYCLMSDHVCYANLESIGRQAGVSKRTAIRALATLEEQGWIVDLTPTFRNASHVYQVTHRLAQSREAHTEAVPPAVTESQSAMTDSPPWGSDTPLPLAVTHSQPTLPESHPAVTDSHPTVTTRHSDSDSLSPPAVTHSHLNQTPERDSLTDEPEIDESEEEEVDLPEWEQVSDILKYQYGARSQYIRWLPALVPVSFDGAVLIVAAPDAYQANLLNARIARSASTILSGLLNRPGMIVSFVAESPLSSVVSRQLKDSDINCQGPGFCQKTNL